MTAEAFVMGIGFPPLYGGVLRLEVPDVSTVRPLAVVLTVVAAVLLFRFQWSVLRVLGVCALLGLAAGAAGLPVT